MAENDQPQPTVVPPAPTQQVKMQVLGQFIRDLSFENVVMQKKFEGNVVPDVQVQVTLNGEKRAAENQYEVISKYSIKAKNKGTEDMLFLLELEYGGMFHIEGIPAEQLHPFLLIECPRMLFPFVRRLVADITKEGGFAPLNLDLIDFVTLYRQGIAARTAAQEKAPTVN
jgi:preprotein translocase subunit SecB